MELVPAGPGWFRFREDGIVPGKNGRVVSG